jgi:hypothetical protein
MKKPRSAMAKAMIPSSRKTRAQMRISGGKDSKGRDRSNQRVQIAAGRTGAVRKTMRVRGFG